MPDSKKYNLSKNSDLIKKFLKENENSKSNNVAEEIINDFENKQELANISQNEAIEKLEDKQQKLSEKIEKVTSEMYVQSTALLNRIFGKND